MKFVEKFKKFPILFYAIQVVLYGATFAVAYVYYDLYSVWREPQLFIACGGLCILTALNGILIGLSAERGWLLVAVEGVAFGAFCGLQTYFCNSVLGDLFELSNAESGYVSLCLTLLQITAGNIFVLFYSQKVFHGKSRQSFAPVIAAALCLCMLGGAFYLPAKKVLEGRAADVYEFLSEPSVYYSSDGNYRVLFATNAEGTGEVHVTKDGADYVFYDEINGTQRFDSIFHRVEVPQDILDGATYRVASRRTLDGKNYGIRLGETILGKTYSFRGYSKEKDVVDENGVHVGDVSFICISDIQGPYKAAQEILKKTQAKYDYDFVLMLGDFSNQYNDDITDFVEPILKVGAIASASEIPCLYVVGNHENKGMKAKFVNELLPTPSPDGELYYTVAIGGAHFTALNFGDDHDDDMPRYNGINRFDAYKDKEYDWLVGTVLHNREYDGYRYNMILSHIPVLMDKILTEKQAQTQPPQFFMYDYICDECNEKHDYKWKEFTQAYIDMGVDHVVSGHVHKMPRLCASDDCPFDNLQAGSVYGNGQYRNSIVTLANGEMSYIEYDTASLSTPE